MKRLHPNQDGFSAAELVLVLIVVVLLGALGWLFYKNHHKASPAKQASTASTKAPDASATKTSQTPANTTYNVSALGIKLVNLPTDLQDITSSTEVPNTAIFTTTALVQKEPKCSATSSPGIGGMFKRQGTYNASADQGAFTFIKQFNGFWVAFTYAGVPCSQDPETIKMQGTLGDEFKKYLSTSDNLQVL